MRLSEKTQIVKDLKEIINRLDNLLHGVDDIAIISVSDVEDQTVKCINEISSIKEMIDDLIDELEEYGD